YLPAASAGTGKTALAGQIALHVSEQHGPVIFVSMELTDVDLAVRLVSVLTNIRKERLITGPRSKSRAAQLRRALAHLWPRSWSGWRTSGGRTRARSCGRWALSSLPDLSSTGHVRMSHRRWPGFVVGWAFLGKGQNDYTWAF